MKKLLIYGFKPFGKYKKNISEELVKKIKVPDDFKVKKVILPVRFSKRILREIKKFKPDFILGLGQKGKGKLLEIERATENIYNKNGKAKIFPKAPKRYFLNLIFDKIKGTRRDYHSGDYVCNWTRYLIMNYINKHKLNIKFTFLHAPKDFPIKKGVEIITKILNQISKREG